MSSYPVQFQDITEVQDFVHFNEKCDFDILVNKGNYFVDGTSILGLLSLDLSSPVMVTAHCHPSDEAGYHSALKEIFDRERAIA